MLCLCLRFKNGLVVSKGKKREFTGELSKAKLPMYIYFHIGSYKPIKIKNYEEVRKVFRHPNSVQQKA